MKATYLIGDVMDGLRTIPSDSVHCVVTSPPYWAVRSYTRDVDLAKLQIGMEPTVEQWVDRLVAVFREVRRVLHPTGTCWVNLGDSYYSKRSFKGKVEGTDGTFDRQRARLGDVVEVKGPLPKHPTLKKMDLVMQPARFALAAQADGWWVRDETVWYKTNPQPSSILNRPQQAHEKVFLMTKTLKYLYDDVSCRVAASGTARPRGEKVPPKHVSAEMQVQAKADNAKSAATDTRRMRNVWEIPSQPFKGAHFATFPVELPRRCIRAGSSSRGACVSCGAPYWPVLKRWKKDIDDGKYRPPVIATWKRKCACVDEHLPTRCTVLDPFAGAGSAMLAALEMGRNFIGIDLVKEHASMAIGRLAEDFPLWSGLVEVKYVLPSIDAG